LQWLISALSINSDPIISPAIIITLCTLLLALNILDIGLEYLGTGRENQGADDGDDGHGV
jgi:hypothetical protein